MKNVMAYETKIKYVRRRPAEPQTVHGGVDAAAIFRPFFKDSMDHHEEMYAAFFDRSNSLICVTNIGSGALNATTCNTHTLYQTAILSNADSVIICHNHPSGNIKPSSADIQITKRIKSALELFNIRLLDHIIITHDSYNSLCDLGHV